MKMNFLKVLALGLILLRASDLSAANDNQFGTAGAQELKIPVGARNIAMAGAGIAGVHGVDAIFWNPAGLGSLEATQASITHLDYLLDVSVNQAAVATKLGSMGVMALSIKALTMGDIPVTTEQSPEGTGELFAPAMTVVGLTFARQLTDRVSFGATGMFISEDIHRVQASGMAFDFGFVYDPQWHGLRFGATMKNYGPDMAFTGSGFDKDVPLPGVDPGIPDKTVRTESSPFELPSFLQFGIGYDLINDNQSRAAVYGSYQSNNYSNDEVRMGAEYGWKESIYLRGGYSGSSLDQYISGLTFGGGVRLKWGNTNLTFDYAWARAKYFDANQWFSLGFEF
ncbi:MAG: PorV/PorQ family protein [candidate division Zixibacteria bacterium]|nr:PorV/PorQ family protein [candidate division Zixibacteria bacterium]